MKILDISLYCSWEQGEGEGGIEIAIALDSLDTLCLTVLNEENLTTMSPLITWKIPHVSSVIDYGYIQTK